MMTSKYISAILVGNMISLIIAFLFLLTSVLQVQAANIYVDQTLSGNINNGTYSVSNRDNSGLDGDAYTTVQAAINAMNPGDHIYLRGGTYQEGHIDIPPSKNGTGWTEGNYNKLCSYPGEWAILDGENNCASSGHSYGSVLGFVDYDFSATYDLKYWWFERLEIKNGRSSDNTQAAGFFAAGGPFKWRYCYIHDNICTSAGTNPGGLKGHHWHDSLVEFCYFINNGMPSGTDTNAGHILIYSDYNHRDTAQNGYDDSDTSHRPVARNVIRYNYFVGSVVGFKHKSGQIFSGRNPAGGHGWDDTYNNYGDKIHHNIFQNTRAYAIGAHQDFAQVYNNIIDGCARGIMVQYQPSYQFYKVVVYNNSIMNTTKEAMIRFAEEYFSFEPDEHYGWDYNNIFDNCNDYWGWTQAHSLNVVPVGSSGPIFNLSNYYSTDNYFYKPYSADVIRMQNISYTIGEFESQTLTHVPRNVYANSYNASDPLYVGAAGADKYRTLGAHLLEGSDTIADGGIGGNHPYLFGVTIPSYVGATNPSDDDWVAGVLAMDAAWFTSQAAGSTPGWVEGEGNGESSAGSHMTGITPSGYTF